MKRWSIFWGWLFVILWLVVGCQQLEKTPSPLPTPPISPLAAPAQQAVAPSNGWPVGQVLYHANQTGSYQLYVMQDGKTPVLLTPDLTSAVDGNWSPDGTRIALAATTAPDNIQIYIMQADGNNLSLLSVEQPYLNWYPKWSPDGEMLLFVTNRDGNFEIYKAAVNGSFMLNLTQHPYNDQEPDWAPDGKEIVFVSDREGGDGLYLMDVDGSNVQQLLDGSWNCRYPRWSVDGQQIIFTASSAGANHIYIINRDGNNLRKITDRTGDNVMPAWVGADRIIFSGNMGDMTWNLFMINVDGSGLVQLTNTPYSERYPSLRP